MTGIGESLTKVTKKIKTQIKSLYNDFAKELNYHVLDNITGHIPSQSFYSDQIEIPQDIYLADPNYNNEGEIETDDLIFYLPHHGVTKPSSSTTKLRVVFDGSAKSTTNISLNDILHVGSTIQDDLFSILIRFRKHNVVMKEEITKMYRQININSK